MCRGLIVVALLGLVAASAGAGQEPIEVMRPGERVLKSGIEGLSALLIVEGGGRTEAGRLHSDLRGRFRLELGGVTLEVRDGSAVSLDPETGRQSALAALPSRRLDLHDFPAYALESRSVFEEVRMLDGAGREWDGAGADGSQGMIYRDEHGRISGYDVEMPDRTALEVRFLDWISFSGFELPTRVSTLDARGSRVWRIASYREEPMEDLMDPAPQRWLDQDALPAEARAALDAEREFALMARHEGVKAAFLEWLEPGATVFGPRPMTVEDRYATVPEAPEEQPLLQWLPEWIVIAGSRELAFISGRWNLTPVEADQAADFGQYLSVWARSGERWRVLADIGTSQPEARPLTPDATGRMIEARAPRVMMVPDPERLAVQVEGEFEKLAFRDGYASTLRDRGDADVVVLRVGVAAARGVDALTVPEPFAERGPRIEITGSAASAAHDFLATWGVMHFDGAGEESDRLAFLRVWQLETSRWQIIADAVLEMP